MVEICESERAFMEEMRMLTTDPWGKTVLVGLTEEESNSYLSHLHGHAECDPINVRSNREDAAQFSALHGKHERARMQILAAENQLRLDRPARN